MALAILGILGIHVIFFLTTLILGTENMKAWMDDRFQLGIDQEYKRILSPDGETMSLEQFLTYLNQQYLICAIAAVILTLAFFFYFQNQAGRLGSRRPVWWLVLIVNIVFALMYSVVVFTLPTAAEAQDFKWLVTTPFTLLVMIVPYYLSTVIFCDYDAPLSYFIKNAFSGNRNA